MSDQTRRDAAPMLPGDQPIDTPQNGSGPARSQSPARAGTFPRTGYGGLVPPILSLQPSVEPESARSDIDQTSTVRPDAEQPGSTGPSLPSVGAITSDPTPESDAAPDPQTTDLEPAPINPNTGLPMYPVGEITEAPPWKSRQPSTARRRTMVLLGIGVTGLLAAAIWAGFSAYRPADTSLAEEPPAPVTSVPTAEGGQTPMRPEVVTLLGELQVAEASSRFTSGEVNSYSVRWEDPFGFAATARVDIASGNLTATAIPNTEIRRVDGRHFGRIRNDPWVELSAQAAASIPPMLLDGLLDIDQVFPPALASFVIAEDERADGAQRYLIDDARLAAEQPLERDRWLSSWGVSGESEIEIPAPPATDAPAADLTVDRGSVTEAAIGQVLVIVRTGPGGIVASASLSSPAIGGTALYDLLQSSGATWAVHIPAPFAD